MLINQSAVSFADFYEFHDAISEASDSAVFPDSAVSSCDAPFASARSETYRLFDALVLNIFEIRPKVDIEIFYEFGGDIFEILYGVEGLLFVRAGDDGKMIRANHLYMTPPAGARGSLSLFRGRPFKKISFNAANGMIDKALGGYGRELWSLANVAQCHGNHKTEKLPTITTTPKDIAAAFLQIANCDYQRRVKRLFFESKFTEVISRIISRRLPADESPPDVAGFEESQIKKIPGILMERVDSPPSIPELARELSLCESKMERGFKRMFGAPIYAHHRNMCLEQAAMTLLDTDRSISEIASDAGYSGNGNFTNAFKKRYGVSPLRYRRKGRSVAS